MKNIITLSFNVDSVIETDTNIVLLLSIEVHTSLFSIITSIMYLVHHNMKDVNRSNFRFIYYIMLYTRSFEKNF